MSEFVTRSDIKALEQALAKSMVANLTPLLERIQKLEAEVAAREYKGVWNNATLYSKHNMVTLGGNIWHARRASMDKPGTSDAWVLCVKKGRDGRDARDET